MQHTGVFLHAVRCIDPSTAAWSIDPRKPTTKMNMHHKKNINVVTVLTTKN